MSHILDRPVWTALGSSHADFAESNGLARRYPVSVIPFASVGDDEPESYAALAQLTQPGDTCFIVQAAHLPVALPRELTASFDAPVTQMIADRLMPEIDDPRIRPLTEDDAAEMFALADLTKPGPFTHRAQALGTFYGVKEKGRLIAMAGVRFRHPGLHEVSGVCTHPDVRGQGLGRLMMEFMCGKIYAAGDRPFLHTFSDNARAIALYEKLGFKVRSPMHVTAFRRT
ncbi:GNAT family N-acetyltransferase [Terrihabitans soli]|uniref:GNAT family N-acetyltransferase n=1 Tax=Terrihabitans soli TaxID=708113 RepID=A0A6S6QRW0_9HYPH|nr:GNAT family N-acetyltransferase [Terrihabitans soli]BCJ89771.1 GNAT family N-acetyltransferase [Terrihabitans soli]